MQLSVFAKLARKWGASGGHALEHAGMGVSTGLSAKSISYADASVSSALRVIGGSTRASTYPFEDFDRADGTLVNNMTTVSGHTLLASGVGQSVVCVNGNGMYSTANVYTGLEHTSLITRVSGVLSFADVTNQTARGVLMFNGGPNGVSLDKLIHLEVGAGYSSLKITTSGPAGLVPLSGTVSELNSTRAGWGSSANLRNGRYYGVSMEYIAGATDLLDKLVVTLPGGVIYTYAGEPMIRQIMSVCRWGTWQITEAGVRWHSISMGPQRTGVATELAGSPNMADLYKPSLPGFPVNLSFTHTGIGWYTIATGISPEGNTSQLFGTVKLYAKDNAGRKNYFHIHVNCSADGTPDITLQAAALGNFDGMIVSQVRLSTDLNVTGAKQLDIYVNKAISSSTFDYIKYELMGGMTPVLAPVIGATPLSGSSVVRPMDKQAKYAPTDDMTKVVSTLTSGATYTAALNSTGIYHYGAGLAALTVLLPPTPSVAHEFTIGAINGITALTVKDSSGNAVWSGAASSGVEVAFRWNSTNSVWMRIR